MTRTMHLFKSTNYSNTYNKEFYSIYSPIKNMINVFDSRHNFKLTYDRLLTAIIS